MYNKQKLPDKQCASDPMPTRLLKENIVTYSRRF